MEIKGSRYHETAICSYSHMADDLFLTVSFKSPAPTSFETRSTGRRANPAKIKPSLSQENFNQQEEEEEDVEVVVLPVWEQVSGSFSLSLFCLRVILST